jgi:hypothetical protein
VGLVGGILMWFLMGKIRNGKKQQARQQTRIKIKEIMTT